MTDKSSHSLQRRRPSLRRRLLLFLIVPMLAVLVLDAILTYSVALAYANHVHDRDLADDALTVAKMLQSRLPGEIMSPQARFLLEYDPDGREFFAVRSAHHGLLDGSRSIPARAALMRPGQSPSLHNITLRGQPLRAASVAIENSAEPGDVFYITIAENLHARHQEARQILLLAIPLQIILIMVMLGLVWFGVTVGLRVLEPLTGRLARREHDLAPIDAADVPLELLPLTRTIDALFARLRALMGLHERFIADAAHQLRTPLAGLSLHAERALAAPSGADTRDSLQHIQRLTRRLSRHSSQLLALTRAQTPTEPSIQMAPLDMTALLSDVIETRLPDAARKDIDLGYDGPGGALPMSGHAEALHEMFDNLIDNALRHAPVHGLVTVGLHELADTHVCVSVEDDGPGIDEALLTRLGERFFRAPGAPEGGTGLGLAIVGHIAERHGARVVYQQRTTHGLRVEVHFPVADLH